LIRRRGVSAVGNSEDASTWSGTSHYLLQAGRERGFLHNGLDLRIQNLSRKRFFWHVNQLFHGQRPRGFQYGRSFLDGLARKAVQECERLELQEVISHYQVLPARYLLEHSIRTVFYIDTTLQALFATHRMFGWLNRRVAEEAIERERAEYQSASRIITMASWVRGSLLQTYGIHGEQVHTVLPGANLPENLVCQRLIKNGPTTTPDRFTVDRPLRLGFIGKDWKRKGLERLVSAVEILNRKGIPAEIVSIGNVPSEFRHHNFVRPTGLIDKSRDIQRFMQIVESCDVGCVPSHEEPMGIAPLEFLRLGIPVLCTAAGGLSDVCEAAGQASVLLGQDATAEEIAAELEVLARQPDCLQRMRAVAWQRKEHFSWDRAVRELQEIWNPDR